MIHPLVIRNIETQFQALYEQSSFIPHDVVNPSQGFSKSLSWTEKEAKCKFSILCLSGDVMGLPVNN